ncbi:unnamed protein product [Sphenostylis stenocarpa]|uniref:SnoaL-like domain-containing protein n=1 Tax=Sphenostylis stenocarpa TaxID=92480 RepID=A0AA86RSV9_9FABA|nr:unnamed protein product [Sphenostylis stenocarpa]
MDAVINLPTRTSYHCLGLDSNITKRLAIRFPPSTTKCNLQRHTVKKNVLNNSWGRNRILAMALKTGPDSQQNSPSPAETVDQYYTNINGKELRQLDECISEDACFEDYAFTKPFQGKKEVMQFLEQLTECMGRNVKFRVKHIYEGDDLTAAANWHMEWKEKQIPFTRGCTFFKLTKLGKNLIIWRAEVLTESPIKPGSIVLVSPDTRIDSFLTLLKNVTAIFDDFPNLTECKSSFPDFTFPSNHPKDLNEHTHAHVPAGFLRSPHVILTWILKAYSIFIASWLHPLLEGYVKLWSFFVRLLSSVMTLVIFISKTFFK